ncbi:MAG TPA: hypothetical protein PLG47_04190, partial [Candidatus Dojkabacteria bacterium]|nr:hypothetical protein [Candidatus Dojkabacteria bacterium]
MTKFTLSKKYGKVAIFLLLPIILLSLFTFVFNKVNKRASAAPYTEISTRVTIGNSAPAFTAGPTESPATSATSPASIGATITFSGTATDSNGESYYLLICRTNSATPSIDGSAPTCATSQGICTSTVTTSGTGTSCTYTTVSGDSWSNAWYAFVCDNNTTSVCSPSNQGSGDSGSPLFVNHAPTFTASTVSAPVNPGGTITWGSTASDPDGNTVKLLVCKTASMSSGSCTGGSWCTSSLTTSNPTCNYVTPNPYADGTYAAYTYVVDQFNLAATGAAQGADKTYTVNNTTPSVSSVTLNGGSAISLTESTTTNIPITASVTDTNGCTNQSATSEITSVKGYLYRSSVTYATCDTSGEANANNCYPEVSCSAGACSNGVTTYSCTAAVNHYADSTVASTQFPSDTWLTSVKATDDDSAVGTTEISTGVELNAIIGGNTTPILLDYGTLTVGAANNPLDKTLTTVPTGNVGLDVQLKANTANMCTNYSACTGGTPIPITYQKYALAASTTYASGITLSTTNAEVELNVPKQTSTTAPSKQTWWGIQIPTGTVAGIYNGLNTLTYIMGE